MAIKPILGLLQRNFCNFQTIDIIFFSFAKTYLASEIPPMAAQLQDPTISRSVVKEQIQTSFLMAEVFFQTLNIVNITQTPTFDVGFTIFKI